MGFRLIIGNKNYSSWSLRAWLFLTASDLPFEEIRLPLFTDAWQQISQYSPAKRVPVLMDGDIAVWDTSAIYGYVRSQHPSAIGWPADLKAQATARSIAAEMHSGFLGIREQLPQNIRARIPVERTTLEPATQQEINRVEQMWTQAYETYGGPWLFGDFSLADVAYAPVALRFVTYQIHLLPAAQTFVNAVQALPSIQAWAQAAATEPEVISFIDQLHTAETDA
ncbi:glutathione s-transferase [Leptolyngbya sp. Heron Island J]|uniref:glutathione S-transferase family protein n=1 Tax=Leptolyngbya sp. Heron Island J TaxID=1385935 RepID=UPI0003B9965D|nr:glutathione S-transferase family protein [Leptolyngbya sp. Heron Island J]ESA33474.1 glutathione s-transferase [Leptolyngbya sp. Heron Island J]